MKVVINIQDGIYAWLKDGYSDEFDRKRLVKAVQYGTPLTKVFEDIKADILELDYLVDNAKYSDAETRCHNVDYLIDEILKIIDNRISEEGSKENEDN